MDDGTPSEARPLTDDQLIRAVEERTIGHAAFGHAEHVRLARALLTRREPLEVLDFLGRALRELAEIHGKAERYHETITWALVFLIRERMDDGGPEQGWEEFAAANGDLLVWPGALDAYYSPNRLFSDAARRGFLLPDRPGPR